MNTRQNRRNAAFKTKFGTISRVAENERQPKTPRSAGSYRAARRIAARAASKLEVAS